jgi:uncharacterized SAM-binding protein YcdF (DUF218 family)
MAARCSDLHADAIVVLGCRGSAALARRVACAVGLFRAGAAPLIVLSGGGRGPVAEAQRMRGAALAIGVPETALLIEPRSRDTLENARETARLLRSRNLASVLLVSDRTHLPRAALLFRLAGLRVAACAAPPGSSLARAVAAALREIAALPWSLARALFTISRFSDRRRAAAACAKTAPRPAGCRPRSAETARAR